MQICPDLFEWHLVYLLGDISDRLFQFLKTARDSGQNGGRLRPVNLCLRRVRKEIDGDIQLMSQETRFTKLGAKPRLDRKSVV